MVLPTDHHGGFRIKGKVADLGQHGVNLYEGSTKLTAGDFHNRAEYAGEAAVHGWILSVHGWIPWNNPTVYGMIVKELLKRESSCVGMQEHTSMCIASVDVGGDCNRVTLVQ